MPKNNRKANRQKPKKRKTKRKPASTGMVGRFADKKMQSSDKKAVEKDIGQLVNTAIGLLYEDEYYASNVDLLKTGKSPLEKVADVGVPLMQRVTEMARKKGAEVGFETLSASGPILVNEILEIAEKEKAFTLGDDDEKQAALAYTIQEYMAVQFAAGVYDKDQVQAELSTAVNMMDKDQQAELESQMVNVNRGIEKSMGGNNGKLV